MVLAFGSRSGSSLGITDPPATGLGAVTFPLGLDALLCHQALSHLGILLLREGTGLSLKED